MHRTRNPANRLEIGAQVQILYSPLEFFCFWDKKPQNLKIDFCGFFIFLKGSFAPAFLIIKIDCI